MTFGQWAAIDWGRGSRAEPARQTRQETKPEVPRLIRILRGLHIRNVDRSMLDARRSLI